LPSRTVPGETALAGTGEDRDVVRASLPVDVGVEDLVVGPKGELASDGAVGGMAGGEATRVEAPVLATEAIRRPGSALRWRTDGCGPRSDSRTRPDTLVAGGVPRDGALTVIVVKVGG
jgi:hypothetical protein